MKSISFTKMAGAGNDFVIIENKKGLNLKKLAVSACDRANGIGADGLLILDTSKTCDYRMRIINADGSEAEMCGNGARCMAAHIAKEKKLQGKVFSLQTKAGKILCIAKNEAALVALSDPKDYRESVTLKINNRKMTLSFIDTGVPHAVIFVDHLEGIDVQTIGSLIRHHKAFAPKGTNVNFVEQISKTLVANRTYERGVEGETRACGTGSVASALITYLKSNPSVQDKKDARMDVRTASGEILKVTFDLRNKSISNVRLNGSAKFIANGEYYV